MSVDLITTKQIVFLGGFRLFNSYIYVCYYLLDYFYNFHTPSNTLVLDARSTAAINNTLMFKRGKTFLEKKEFVLQTLTVK